MDDEPGWSSAGPVTERITMKTEEEQQEAGIIVFWSMFGGLLIIVLSQVIK